MNNSKWNYQMNKVIYNSLTDEEKSFVAPLGYKKVDSSKLYYYKTMYINNNPVAFIDVYKMPKHPNIGFILIAVHKKYQGLGLGYQLLNDAIVNCKNIPGLDTLWYSYNYKNIKSSNLINRIPNIRLLYNKNNELTYSIDLNN